MAQAGMEISSEQQAVMASARAYGPEFKQIEQNGCRNIKTMIFNIIFARITFPLAEVSNSYIKIVSRFQIATLILSMDI